MSEKEKIKKPIYKRWWFWVVAVFIIVAVAGGGDNTDNNSSTAVAPVNEQKQEQPVTFKVNQEAKVGNLSYVASDIKTATVIGSNPYLQKKTEEQFLLVKIKVTNNDKEARTIDTNLFKLFDTQGKEYSAMGEADLYVNNDSHFFLEQVNPGMSRSGFIVFEIPKGMQGLTLQCSSGLGFSGGENVRIDLGV